MTAIRKDVLNLEPNGIGKVSMSVLGQKDIIPLWFGEGDLVTPKFIRDAAIQALQDGKTFYNNPRGMFELRKAVAAFHKRTVGADVAVERISLPGAATLAVVTAMQCLIQTGDNIVIVSPVWPSIFQAAEVVGAELRFVRLEEDWTGGRWRLDMEKLFAQYDRRTKAIFVCSPGNPTGWIATRAEQSAILDFARKHEIAVISDEVYGTLVYDGELHAPSFLEIMEPDDEVFVVNSFSKPWAMTGWRVGWLVHPPCLDEPMNVITIANNTGPATFAQYGAIAALSPEGDRFRAEMVERCRKGRDVVAQFLEGQNRIRWIRPEGAFYAFLHIDGLKHSLEFCRKIVRDARVGLAPGMAFGPTNDIASDSYVRVCFAQDAALLAEGLERLGKTAAAL
ncbi:MAG: pyridoxal phosphate-dependent aminotransferase [Alphaproteobacteria bacterium]|nr:pyridoxal phosphate-dependent aminotransferase [Alphaproteobacteria bacterium]